MPDIKIYNSDRDSLPRIVEEIMKYFPGSFICVFEINDVVLPYRIYTEEKESYALTSDRVELALS